MGLSAPKYNNLIHHSGKCAASKQNERRRSSCDLRRGCSFRNDRLSGAILIAVAEGDVMVTGAKKLRASNFRSQEWATCLRSPIPPGPTVEARNHADLGPRLIANTSPPSWSAQVPLRTTFLSARPN